MKMRAIFLCDGDRYDSVFPESIKSEISRDWDIKDVRYRTSDVGREDFSDVVAIFSTWGMPKLTEDDIKAYFPSLKYLFYAAGSVQPFARPFLNLGIKVFSAWQANAVPVAEYSVAQILLATKGFFALYPRKKKESHESLIAVKRRYKGNYGAKVGILGDGAIGSLVIEELLRHKLEVWVFSITMTEERAKELGVKLASLKEIFAECDVISNHLANNEKTQGIINRALIESMKPYTTFINTGRGAQVDEAALADKLASDNTISAALDVTFPEPPLPDSPLLRLDNVTLTPHIAGSDGYEVQRMSQYMIDEYRRLFNGEPALYEVSLEMLERMA